MYLLYLKHLSCEILVKLWAGSKNTHLTLTSAAGIEFQMILSVWSIGLYERLMVWQSSLNFMHTHVHTYSQKSPSEKVRKALWNWTNSAVTEWKLPMQICAASHSCSSVKCCILSRQQWSVCVFCKEGCLPLAYRAVLILICLCDF